jgi:hypothetical protein
MADPTVDWETCADGDCAGVRLPTGQKCWAHAADADLEVALKRLGEDGRMDARGVPLTQELLKRLLAAAPRDDHGHTVLTDPRFDKAAFKGKATFKGGPGFYGTVFKGTARFFGATFEGTASFGGATFEGDAAFHGATFEGTAAFHGATFEGTAGFDGVTFKGEARFVQAWFQQNAEFDWATFHGDAWFNRVRVNYDAYFLGSTFQRARQLGPMLVRKGLLLDGAVFYERAHIEVSAAALCCRRTRFPAGVNLRVRWAQIVLDDADLAAPSILTGVPHFPDLDEGRWARGLERLLPEPRFKPELRSRPRLLSLRRADVAGLTVASVDLRATRFAGAHHLDQLRVGEEASLGYTPGGWRWTTRLAIAEERYWRAHRHRDGTTLPAHHATNAADGGAGPAGPNVDWYEPANRPPAWLAMEPPSTLQIAAIYRALRKGREDSRDEPGAADFYYGEMEMRRHDKHAKARAERRVRHYGHWATAATERAVLWLYWLTSGYGLRAWRAMAALAVVIGLFGIGFSQVGFDHPHPSLVASWLYALQAAVSLEGKARQLSGQLTLPGELLRVGLRFTGPVLLALAVLSIRGRVKR